MLVLAVRSVFAEPAFIPYTLPGQRLRLDMQKKTLVVITHAVDVEKETLRHLSQVVLVQELAALVLLAESPQPVLAHHRRGKLDVQQLAVGVPALILLVRLAVYLLRFRKLQGVL